jgi:hypothetical protein
MAYINKTSNTNTTDKTLLTMLLIKEPKARVGQNKFIQQA